MQSPGWRRYRQLLVGAYAVLLVASVFQLALLGCGHWYLWVQVVGFTTCLVGWSTWSRLQRKRLARMQRSLQLNPGTTT